METRSMTSHAWLALAVVVLSVATVASLQKNANHVITEIYYVKEEYFTWNLFELFTAYRSASRERYVCEAGWTSLNGISCDYALCNGLTNLNGACNTRFGDSHIIYTDGTIQYYPDGSCNSPNSCTCTKAGFYSGGPVCSMCTAISNCNLETCTTATNRVCSRCEGTVQERVGYRAYVPSSDKRACNKACSWRPDSTRCYPGSCPTELASSCTCSSGFEGLHCQNIVSEADIVYNELKLTAVDGSVVTAPLDINSGPSAAQNDVWTNIVAPANIFYQWDGQFHPTLPNYHAYITDAKVGVTGGKTQLILNRGTTVQVYERTCGGYSRDNPNREVFTCSATIQPAEYSGSLTVPFQHGDWLEFSFHADVGGFVKVENKETRVIETHYFNGNTKTHQFQVHFDTIAPYHCNIASGCADSMLTVEEITKSSRQNILWSGWKDDDAGVNQMTYQVYELDYIGTALQHKTLTTHGTVNSTGSGSTSFSVTSPGMYSIVLSALDQAGNYKSCRRLFLYDSSSYISITVSSVLRVTSAAQVTSFTWQHREGDVTLSWVERYTNVFHYTQNLLAAVFSEPDVESAYDDSEGHRTVAAIQNTLGIVKFTTAWAVDAKGGTTQRTPSNTAFSQELGLAMTKTIKANVVDGQSLTFWVRAYDIREDYYEETLTVHVDSSPPVIINLWLTKDNFENISVHGLEELKTMTIEWVAYDDHSGLYSVQWQLVDNYNGQNIVHGVENVSPQGETNTLQQCQTRYGSYARGANCYCTGPVGCYHRHFQVKPVIVDISLGHGGIFTNASVGVHDYDYYIQVTVVNHAKLSTTIRKQITLDASPPHPGVVNDGIPDSPEVDYQYSRTLHAYWSDFFDRESGIKFYQYAFHTSCLNSSVFGHKTQDSRVVMTYETTATWSAPADGTFYITVVAFNSAIEPSSPVCSDGVTVDQTSPKVSHVYVAGAYIAPGLIRASDNRLWLVTSDRTIRLVENPDQACINKATPGLNLEFFPLSPIMSPVQASEACQYQAFESRFTQTFYLSRDHHLYLNWSAYDNESGIYDYEVGLASTKNYGDAPDISPFTSTHHHNFYQNDHPSLPVGAPFYIFTKAQNKAGNVSYIELGPVVLIRSSATYSGTLNLTLESDILVVRWDVQLFTDPEKQHLKFYVALEELTSGTLLHPKSLARTSGSCIQSTPPSCAAFNISELHWGLHQQHAYVAKVQVTNIVGLDLMLTSEPYVHDTRLAARGTVFDVVPSDEETILFVPRSEDTDFQLSKTTYEARWSGFDSGAQQITYKVGLGSRQGADDVASFVMVGTVTAYVFAGLSLQKNKQYFCTVIALTNGGQVAVSSDGVLIIEANEEVNIKILDGPGCNNSTEPVSWSPEQHEDKPFIPCEDDASFQLSHSMLWCHWTLTAQQKLRFPDVQWRIQKAVPGVETWTNATEYQFSTRTYAITAEGLALQPGNKYRVAIKFCVGNLCSKPAYSSGVIIVSGPARTGSISVTYVEGMQGNNSTLEIRFEKFRDPDISDLAAAQTVMYSYQWSLTDSSHDSHLLQAWKTIPKLQILNASHSSFAQQMPRNLSFHRCLRVSLLGTNKVGLVSLLSSDVKNCSAKDPHYIVPKLVLDASGGASGASLAEGQPVSLGFNDEWSQEDEEYTTHTNIISAVWPTLRHSRVRWAVLESQGPDASSLFINEEEQNMTDPCSSVYAVACGEISGQKYINVFFGPPHERSLLEDGHRYYVCVHAEAETVVHEKWSEVLQEVSACSDGITVDQTPPQEGVVYIDGLLGGIYQSSLKTLSVRWDGFSDVEELGLSPHHSGILRYYISVGSTPGGQDVLNFHDVGQVNQVVLHTLNMQSGHTYYVTVRAEDNVGLIMDGISSSFVVDNTAPKRTDKQMQFPETFITSHTSFSVCWEAMFEDAESGVASFIVSLGSRPGHDDIMEGQVLTTTCGDFIPDTLLVEGHAYYITIKAMNGAGLFTSAVSRPRVVMTAVPAAGHVYDGPPPTDGGVAFDVDFTRSPSDVAAFWRGFSTSLSPVATYYVRLGTCSGCDDIVGEFDIGLSQEVTWNHVSLSEGVRYYTTVRACNGIDWCTEIKSDGILIDTTPPIAGDVWDGAGDADISFQSQRDFLAAKWTGFVDVSSGLAGFTWRSGTSPGAADIMASRSVGLALEAFTSDLSTSLPENRTIYITITAKDRAGNWIEVTSNGFKVDTTAPTVKQVPQLNGGLGTLGGPRLVSRDTLSARWSREDAGSPLAAHFVSITSHLLGEFESRPLQVPAPVSVYTFTSLSLHDGSLYRVKVTSCNVARLCATSVSEEILHDSTPPVTGMFAVKTDHAANLRRHLDGWMVWSSQQLRLAWLGFLDVHSGLDHYIISVGSTPFANDLNLENTVIKVFHNGSGTQYENEGFVQVYEVSTKPLTAALKIFIAIWAVNKVGLQSHPALSEFELEDGGGMSLVRRCTPFNCLAQCSCAVQGATCNASSCAPLPEESNPNSLLAVYDHADLTTLISPRTSSSSSSSSEDYTPSSSYLAASWNVTVSRGLKPNRYEVSAGRSDQATPAGVFRVALDRIWMDVGLAPYSLLTIPSGSPLIPKLKYSTFVRAWYPNGNFALFKSKGIIPLPNRPSVINLLGRGVKELGQAGQDKDVDYVTRSDSLHTSWRGTFLNTTAPLQSFQVYVGTSIEGNDVHSSGPLSGNTESYYATGLSLREDTLYYTTVVAVGSSGLMSWDVSDGFMLDLQPPVAGLVLDGDGLHDIDYQLYDQLISAKWFGFTDSGSGIRRFYWCVGTTNDSDTCNVMQWTDVGLKTKGSFTPSSPLNQGTIFYSKVYAVDAVGHRSSVSVSDGVKVDITPPRALDIIYTDNINHVNNPSFEDDVTSNTGQIVCDSKPPSSWKIGPGSCIILQHPRHVISADGTQHVLLSGAVMQNVSGLTSGLIYRLTVRLAHPETLRDHHKPVQGYVQIGTQQHTFTLDPAMCRGVCDTEKEPVIMWHSFTYVVTAHNSTLTLVISTTSSSTDQQLALDHVVLETIHYVQQTETSRNVTSESHLSASAVFLPHWSMVQSSWHFLDNDSPITDYKWALGTVAGGVQIQGFKGVGQRQHGSALGLTLHHGTPLYVTVVATNAAGLTTVAYSSPLLVDMTPPVITDLIDGTQEDVDFQTGFFIGASWRATDNESSVAYCQWAIGFEAGSGEISPFQRAPQPSSNTYTITADVGFSLKDLKLPQTLYVSVRCYNKAGLPGFGHTDGLTITPDNEEAKLGGLRLLGDSITVYPVREACHVMQNRLLMSWQNFASLNPLAGFQIDHYSNIDQDSYQTKNLPYLLEATRISGLALTNNTMHTWSVSPVDAFGSVGKAVNKSVHVSMNAPTAKASGQAEFNRNGTHLTLSWRNLFTSDWPDHDLTFEVSVGSVKGGTDILHWHKTTDSSVIVSFVPKVTPFSLYYIVTAIDPCGYHLASTGSVKIN